MIKRSRLASSPIAYYTHRVGCGEWVLFLHAAFVDHRMFAPQLEAFAGSYNLLAVDILGHGGSADAQKGASIEQMADWIREILRAEKIEKIHLAGVSLGAVLAQDLANRYPEAVASLACFGGYDINNFDPKLQRQNSAAQLLMMLKALVSIRWFAAANKKISAFSPAAQEAFYRMNLTFPKRSLRYFASLGRMVNRQQTAPRQYPLLIGCGAQDIPLALRAAEDWKAREPQAELVVFEDAGHCVNMDVPQRFNEVMEDFWKRSGTRPGTKMTE